MDKIKLIVIAGPTASGKTSLSLDIAEKYGGEIVSADSMQIYRGMDIGSAKPSMQERRGIPHHLLDICDISQFFSVADYVEAADEAIKDIASRGRVPIIAGGTGLYIDSLLTSTSFGKYENDMELRRELEREASRNGGAALHERLRDVDPESAARLHINDIKRIIRALEVYSLTGRTMTQAIQSSRTGERRYDVVYIALTFRDRQKLYDRINLRVDKMLEDGLEYEVGTLAQKGLRTAPTAGQAIGYKELLEYIDGKCSLCEAVDSIKMNTRRYAKRQLSWFRRSPDIEWIEADDLNDSRSILEAAEKIVGKTL
ncbi:MAG: tRNA (adenosine(37)-N6)-dimethylallyltransferase MiaA [Eubacteriales bacterium]